MIIETIYKKFKIIISIILSILMISCISCFAGEEVRSNEEDTKLEVIYFYSPTCSSCFEVNNFLENIKEKNESIKICKYNIFDEDNHDLISAYCSLYKTKSEETNVAPIIFIRNVYLFDEDNIKDNLQNIIDDESRGETLSQQYVKENYKAEEVNINSLSLFKLGIAALLNGLNPCSFSMFMVLLMLLGSKHETILKIGVSFCFGKVLSFFLIGTVCYRLFGRIKNDNFILSINFIIIFLYFIFSALNIHDFIVIKKHEHGKIKSQLPTSFRKFGHKIISYYGSKFLQGRLAILFAVLLGMIISATEFLCSGQIYLSAIVTVIQNQSIQYVQACMYLLIYSFICTIPLILVVILILSGKKNFQVSMLFTKNVSKIKLIYAVFFFIFAIYMITKII